MNDDERLKAAFERLRAEDARRAPSFEATRQRRRARVSPWAVLGPAVPVLAAAALLVMRCGSHDDAAPQATPMASVAPAPSVVVAVARPRADDAPLDFLLEIPGLRGIPDFDTSSLRGSLR